METKKENYNTYGNVHTASYFVPELVCGNSITGEMVRNCRITVERCVVKGKEEQRLGLILISVQADIVAILGRIWKR